MVHEVMQIAFSWHGYHLHQFETACGAFGRPDDDSDWGFEEVGDESAVAYPRCTGGRSWAPEVDSGGIWAHNEAVAAAGPVMPFTPTALGALAEPT
jgi:hypothetical protein